MATGKIGLPELSTSQAGKEETVNEAVRGVEAFASGCTIEDRDLAAPPVSCADGACYLVAASPTGAWSGKSGKIAVASGANASNGWSFYNVFEGLSIWVRDENTFLIRNDSSFAVDPNIAPVVAAAVAATAIDDLSDVNATAPADGDSLIWDDGAGEWVAAPAPLPGGGGTVPNGGSTGAVLTKASGVDQDTEWKKPIGVLIAEIVTTGSATNVQFASIPATYRDLEIRIRGRGTKVATSVDIRMRFNGDTGTNYDTETQQANGSTNANFGNGGTTSAYVGNLAASSATSNVADYIEIAVADYRGTTFQKAGRYIATLKTGIAAVTNFFNEVGSIWWRSTAAINQIDVFPSSNAFVDGTVVSLYGRF